MDWQAWARRFEAVDDLDSWVALFAEERAFRDPVTPWTSDIHGVAELTRSIFPDWAQRVDDIRYVREAPGLLAVAVDDDRLVSHCRFHKPRHHHAVHPGLPRANCVE